MNASGALCVISLFLFSPPPLFSSSSNLKREEQGTLKGQKLNQMLILCSLFQGQVAKSQGLFFSVLLQGCQNFRHCNKMSSKMCWATFIGVLEHVSSVSHRLDMSGL